MLRLESENFVNMQKPNNYSAIQIKRHGLKCDKQEDIREYEVVASGLKTFYEFGQNDQMICMGTRNNHERDTLSEFIHGVTVYSLDISPDSHADYVMDFTRLPADWTCKWDLIYSNSIDHSYDPTATFVEWIRVLKPGGILMLGMNYGTVTSITDISSFSQENVANYLNSRNDVVVRKKVTGFTNPNGETLFIEKLITS